MMSGCCRVPRDTMANSFIPTHVHCATAVTQQCNKAVLNTWHRC